MTLLTDGGKMRNLLGITLANKVALISGAASGIGAAQAQQFAAAGAQVVLADIDLEQASELSHAINSLGFDTIAVSLDVRSEKSWQQAVSATEAEYGHLTTLLNTAGVYRRVPLFDETTEGFQKVVATNQLGVFLGMKVSLPSLISSGNASILNMASFAAVKPDHGFSYSASKAAVLNMTRSVAREYGPKMVRANTILPGPVDTPMIAMEIDAAAAALGAMPLGKIAEADDIAYGSLFLSSDFAGMITGIEMYIDGGMSVL